MCSRWRQSKGSASIEKVPEPRLRMSPTILPTICMSLLAVPGLAFVRTPFIAERVQHTPTAVRSSVPHRSATRTSTRMVASPDKVTTGVKRNENFAKLKVRSTAFSSYRVDRPPTHPAHWSNLFWGWSFFWPPHDSSCCSLQPRIEAVVLFFLHRLTSAYYNNEIRQYSIFQDATLISILILVVSKTVIL